ncbi:peptide-methionine (S)-S-oxide reductase MsrA [Aquipuribacter hungaricus]|uniref:Peptide methionine sulfoxide reductase MsrA n=1 Tax=Aquipuribacter hungaricus TaxID=545624 RepID=A0ABV7WBS1_9MICO
MLFGSRPTTLVTAEEALPGRDTPVSVPARHTVKGTPLVGPWPEGHEVLYVAMGCFWGAERIFWRLDGVHTTAVGYMGGHTPNPTYEETCTARTGHAEAALVVYDPAVVSLDRLFKEFWENHDPTTPNRQGNDVGTQYRSAVYTTTDAQLEAARSSRERYQRALTDQGYGQISTEIRSAAAAGPFYYAESYHQQYLAKNPGGYCNHGFCQVGYDLAAHGQTAARATLPTA